MSEREDRRGRRLVGHRAESPVLAQRGGREPIVTEALTRARTLKLGGIRIHGGGLPDDPLDRGCTLMDLDKPVGELVEQCRRVGRPARPLDHELRHGGGCVRAGCCGIQHRGEHGRLVAHGVVDRLDGYARAGGDRPDRSADVALLGEELRRGVDDLGARDSGEGVAQGWPVGLAHSQRVAFHRLEEYSNKRRFPI